MGNTKKDKLILLATYTLSAEFMAWKYKSEWKTSHITIVLLIGLASYCCKSLRTDNTESAFNDAVIYTRVYFVAELQENIFHVYGSLHRLSMLIIVQRDTTRSSLFIILQVHCACFGWQPHPSSGVHKTVTTASGTVQLPPSNVAKHTEGR